eukprot:7654033-Alexandrium_andersonii.AAC.1
MQGPARASALAAPPFCDGSPAVRSLRVVAQWQWGSKGGSPSFTLAALCLAGWAAWGYEGVGGAARRQPPRCATVASCPPGPQVWGPGN